jgi:hypothetical protein
MKQILCQKRVDMGICPISRKFKEKQDGCPFIEGILLLFLGNNLELLGKVLPLLGLLDKHWNWRKVYLNCHD